MMSIMGVTATGCSEMAVTTITTFAATPLDASSLMGSWTYAASATAARLDNGAWFAKIPPKHVMLQPRPKPKISKIATAGCFDPGIRRDVSTDDEASRASRMTSSDTQHLPLAQPNFIINEPEKKLVLPSRDHIFKGPDVLLCRHDPLTSRVLLEVGDVFLAALGTAKPRQC